MVLPASAVTAGDLVIDGELTIRGVTRPVSSALTAAELRLLPLLSTHLSFPQIAGELFLSRFTVKSQAMSIYRKLGACSRSQAVTRSRELGLLEGMTTRSFIPSGRWNSPPPEMDW
jgi:ATP/maltotriose-dependent transcriptional regulator MalT